jgi:hypothetical protein
LVLGRFREALVDRRAIADVELEHERLRSARSLDRARRVGQSFATASEQREARSFAREAQRDRAADSGSGAGDEDVLIGEARGEVRHSEILSRLGAAGNGGSTAFVANFLAPRGALSESALVSETE